MNNVYKYTSVVGVVSTITLIFGAFAVLANGFNGGIPIVIVGLLLMFISYSIYKIAANLEKQNIYFKNRIADLEKQIDQLKKSQ
ncbi:hypothetical protein E3U55_06380 [Filobacillus milosensis]|uniref:Uncharacterized protein n=1 Tax=Filobacillus milosensis TaxID=94137 RepID=A0A4Y8INE8_9BACI|nr:hypothetical protein [Filobacillus milosensis]TFB22861.1 hypothetical protein E3U55_06380 [Filobacillus milosensis]